MNEPTSILAFRNGSIGNTLVAVPALRALRRRFPSARLSVVVDRIGYELLEHFPWINQLIIYDKRGQHRSIVSQAGLVSTLRKQRPSHAVLFKRFFRNGLLAYLSGAPVRAGFETDGKAPFLTVTVPYDESVNVIDLNLRLADLLGASTEDRSLELHLTADDRARASDILSETVGIGTRYIVAYYGGQTVTPDTLVPPSVFTDLVHYVAEGRFPVILIGSGERETSWASSIRDVLPNSYVSTGLPIRVSAALIERATLMIGLNSGPTHVAAAVKSPALVLIRPDIPGYSEERKWLPSGDNIFSLQIRPDILSGKMDWGRILAVQQAREHLTHMRGAPVI